MRSGKSAKREQSGDIGSGSVFIIITILHLKSILLLKSIHIFMLTSQENYYCN